jgi:hypothetical protein
MTQERRRACADQIADYFADFNLLHVALVARKSRPESSGRLFPEKRLLDTPQVTARPTRYALDSMSK